MEVLLPLIIALGLAMDICAIGLSSGAAIQKDRAMLITRIAFLVALFHALMLICGWSFGFFISDYIGDKTKYVAAFLLMLIGANMVREALSGNEEQTFLSLHLWSGQIILAFASSIDALAVGVSYGVVHNNVLPLVLITIPTILIATAAAFWLGGKISKIFGKHANIWGGVVLILIGIFFLF